MPYKRNPMRCERICALSRYVMVDAVNPAVTAATQWFERTLDDSANKRLSVPEAFLAVDAILNIYANVASGLVVHEKVIERHVLEELPFMASENIMMDAVKRGGNRQDLHERIRVHSLEAGRNVKDLGLPNNLIDLIAADPLFGMSQGGADRPPGAGPLYRPLPSAGGGVPGGLGGWPGGPGKRGARWGPRAGGAGGDFSGHIGSSH